MNRRDSIATRVKDEFAMSSPVWQRWTDKTDITNTTSLSQVIAEYFQTQSIGDIGGKNVEYIPRRGYPGTLAPGELFKDDSPPDLLPKRLMHPWPAMQEIQFHGRNPVSHPMIPPPVLWAGMNNMFLNNLTTTVLRDSSPTQPVTGGQSMNPADAILIARYATFGKSYEPSQQIKHGGSIFTSGRQIPNYHPDHGPTISDEEAEPPIPKELRPLIERWYSPYDDRDSVDPKTEKEIESQELAATEEEERRAKFEAMYESMQGNLWAIEERKEAEERKAAIEDRYMQLYTRELDRMRVLNMVDMVDIEEITSFTSSISPHGSTGKKKPKTPSRRGKRKDGTIDPIDDSNMDEFSIDDRINSIESVDDDITALMSPSIPATDVSEISLSSDETNESAHEATLISTDRDSTDDSSVTQEPGEDAGEAFPKAQRDEWMAKATREVTLQREVMAAASEKIVRFKRPLTQYVIAMMRERNIDVIDAERNVQLASNSKKK